MKKSKKKRSADSSDANAVTVAITSFVGEPKGREMVTSLGSSKSKRLVLVFIIERGSAK